jgi:hypothetical protein
MAASESVRLAEHSDARGRFEMQSSRSRSGARGAVGYGLVTARDGDTVHLSAAAIGRPPSTDPARGRPRQFPDSMLPFVSAYTAYAEVFDE